MDESRVALSQAPGDGGPRRSLVLAGGGRRLTYQAGVLRALHEGGMRFAHADATSGGSVNLAMLFSGQSPAEVCERWRKLEERERFAFLSSTPLPASGRAGLFELGGGFPEHLLARLGIDLARINAALGMEGTFNVGNLTTQTNRVLSHRELTSELLLGAISLPGYMPPVHVDGVDYVDSVCIQNANLLEAVRRGAEEIWLVWGASLALGPRPEPLDPYEQIIEMSASGALSSALGYVAELNERIARGDSPWQQRWPIRLKVVKPEYPLPPLDGGYPRGGIDTMTLLDLGYADAWRRLATRASDDALDVAVTSLRRPEAAVAFSERFTGLMFREADAPDPGNGDGVFVDLTLAVFIYGLAAFLSDPGAGARLAGHVSWGGATFELRDGWFRAEPLGPNGARRLVYTACFEPNGVPRPIELRLERTLSSGVISLVRELTASRALVRDGTDATARTLARGVLETSVDDLSLSCRTLQALEPESPRDGARAIVQLGRYLFGELYDQYTGRPWWKVW